MNRPKDIYGNEIKMGPWYWARSRTGQIAGTGKFASCINSDECTFFINGTGYGPESFTYVKVVDDPMTNFLYPESGPPHEVVYER